MSTDNAHYGTAVNPKLSAGGYPLPVRSGALSSIKVSANVGSGIKNPTFSQLYGSQWVDGDLSLQPEHAVTADIGAELTFADQRWLARATWFNNSYTEQIAWAPSLGGGGDGVADYVNIAGSRAAGLELEFALQRARWRVDGGRLLRDGRHGGGVQRQHERAVPAGTTAAAPAAPQAVTCASAIRGGARVCT